MRTPLSQPLSRAPAYEKIPRTPKKGGPNEGWVLLFHFVCNRVRAVAELSDARNAAHSGWQTQSHCARAANGGRKAGPQRAMEQIFQLSRQHYQGSRSGGCSAV